MLRVVFGHAPGTWFENPVHVWTAETLDAAESALRELDTALDEGYFVAGALSYELGVVRHGLRAPRSSPLLILGAFHEPTRAPLQAAHGRVVMAPPISRVSYAQYAASVDSLLGQIRDGEVYQVNYTVPFDAALLGDPFDLYRSLAESSNAGYCAYLEHDRLSLVSISPELFLHVDDSVITTKPMKGTATLANIAELSNEKNRAEHLMIVDLLRNDLHRICDDVRVQTLFEIERYPSFATMTSTIAGSLRTGMSFAEIVAAMFPCGSVTGAPKRAAMQQIHLVEREPRGFYTGSVGFLTPERRGWWNVAIRTLQIDRSTSGVRFDAGGGIVSESTAESEWSEIHLKSRFLEPASDEFAILETLRSDAGPAVVDEHLDRLERSAAAFSWIVDRSEVFERIRAFETSQTPLLVHVRVYRDGVRIEAEPIHVLPTPIDICLSSLRVRSDDPMLRHKTSLRPIHDAAMTEAASMGCFDAILCNEREELTEGSRTNVFLQIGGVLYTPPLASGVLPGILRARLLKEKRAVDSSLLVQDLREADAVYVGNSARGLLRASLRHG